MMILTDKMLALAFDVRDAKPWEILDDTCLFAVQLSCGQKGYCCVMGNGGEHYSVALYIGQRGFTDFMRTLDMGNESGIETLELGMQLDYIACDFSNADMLDPMQKKRTKEYASATGRKIRRPYGWPDFVRHAAGKPIQYLTDESDATAITEALEAVLALLRKLEDTDAVSLGFDPDREYPTGEGGKTIPLLTPNADGTYHFGTTVLPPVLQNCYEPTVFRNDIMRHAISKLPQKGTLECKYFHLPSALPGVEGQAQLLPVLLCVNELEFVHPVFPKDEDTMGAEYLPHYLGEWLLDRKQRPREIQVCEKRTEALLQDFCKRCGIKLTLCPSLTVLNDVCEEFMMQMMLV